MPVPGGRSASRHCQQGVESVQASWPSRAATGEKKVARACLGNFSFDKPPEPASEADLQQHGVREKHLGLKGGGAVARHENHTSFAGSSGCRRRLRLFCFVPPRVMQFFKTFKRPRPKHMQEQHQRTSGAA